MKLRERFLAEQNYLANVFPEDLHFETYYRKYVRLKKMRQL